MEKKLLVSRNDAELMAAEQYSGGGRNGVVYARPEKVPVKVAGDAVPFSFVNLL